ncbi:MAG: hypothetical protein CSA75_01190 [Sorangium cellulosum]|nr:MAG: hypothetical protein CSA75_01190 [Sorangium cellulosum]
MKVKLLVVAVLATLYGVSSCAGSSTLRPTPSLAHSLEAQASFQPIRARWLLSTKRERTALLPSLRAFQAQYRGDPLARVASAYLAFVALDRNELDQAAALAREIRMGPIGNTRDLGTIVDGASLAHAGQPEAALQLLDPLVGKMIDSFAKDLLHEAAVNAAVDAHRWYQAVVYMNEWVRGTNEQEMAALRDKLDKLLVQFPAGSLETALRAMGAVRQKDLWERELRQALAMRLTAVAMERSDPKLARSVLNTSRRVVGLGEEGTLLARLATSGGRAPRIVGATVGLMVDTDSQLRSGRSAQVVAGVLQVFHPGHRGPRQQSPSPILITQDVPPQGSLENVLDDLAYKGASVIIAGYDAKRAAQVARYAEAQSISVLLLVAPDQMPRGARFTFVVGTEDPSWQSPVSSQAASQVDLSRSVRVGSGKAPEGPLFASCDSRPPRAAQPAFPVAAWREANVEAVAIDGSRDCASRVLADLDSLGFTPMVYLGLEAREAKQSYRGQLRVGSCGLLDAEGASEPDSLRQWRLMQGSRPTFFQALGRDAAKIAYGAVARLPRGTVSGLEQVMKRRVEVQQALVRAENVLWTSTNRGFDGERRLRRQVQYEPVGKHRL